MGQPYVVPDLEFHECPACGEQLYGPEAMRKIQAYSPAYAKRRAARAPVVRDRAPGRRPAKGKTRKRATPG